jgi:zinc transport system substrate-binding protein
LRIILIRVIVAGTMRRLTLLLLIVMLALTACGEGGEEEEERRRPRVVAAFYPLEFIARQVAGGRADITNLTPAGVEPHDLELTSGQVRRIREADLLIYVGGGFQTAVEEVVPQMEGRALDTLQIAPSNRADPHIWLDPVLMEEVTNSVRDALSEIDGRSQSRYTAGAVELIGELRALDDSFQNGLALCQRREFVTSHSAFGYLASRFNLEQIAVSGIDPEQEPSPRRLQEVADLVESRRITTIFFESRVPSDVAETIARETGATTAKLDPIESAPDQGDYFGAMRANLVELRKALSCR